MSGNTEENDIKQACDLKNMIFDRASSPEYQKFMEYRNSLPAALRPVYTTEQPNQPILLYEGALEINQHSVQIQGQGKVEYEWFPSPRIKFEFLNQDRDIDTISCAHFNNQPILLTLSDIPISVDVFITSSSSGGNDGNFVSGRIKEPIILGTD